ncbi:MAG: hypothetical protein ACI4AB_01095 [Acetatifactor sp.]
MIKRRREQETPERTGNAGENRKRRREQETPERTGSTGKHRKSQERHGYGYEGFICEHL